MTIIVNIFSNTPMELREPLFEYVSPGISKKIIHGDSLNELRRFDKGKFDLIITSPPYNVGKSYEVRQSIEKYLETQSNIIHELVRTLSDRGSLCWQVGNYVDKGK